MGYLYLKFNFAHPYASLERGLSEYSNKLISQHIPKQSEFIEQVQHKVKRRPRKNLNFKCPKDLFYNCVAFDG